MSIPNGYEEIAPGIYFSPAKAEIVVTGIPAEDDEQHNCDDMGCSSVSHVIFRGFMASYSFSRLVKPKEPYYYPGREEQGK